MSNKKKLPSRERSYPWRKVLGPLADVKRIVERNRFGFQLVPREDLKEIPFRTREEEMKLEKDNLATEKHEIRMPDVI